MAVLSLCKIDIPVDSVTHSGVAPTDIVKPGRQKDEVQVLGEVQGAADLNWELKRKSNMNHRFLCGSASPHFLTSDTSWIWEFINFTTI